jgi:hypothetical protein
MQLAGSCPVADKANVRGARRASLCAVPRLRCALVVVDSLAHGYSRMKQLMPDPVIVLFAMDDMAAVGMR